MCLTPHQRAGSNRRRRGSSELAIESAFAADADADAASVYQCGAIIGRFGEAIAIEHSLSRVQCRKPRACRPLVFICSFSTAAFMLAKRSRFNCILTACPDNDGLLPGDFIARRRGRLSSAVGHAFCQKAETPPLHDSFPSHLFLGSGDL